MRKIYTRFGLLTAIIWCFAFGVKAQLSGPYTINSLSPTGGTNYNSFTDFVNDINSNGVSGAVEVNVIANTGPYVEQVLFNQITGASSFNDITINGNGNLITYNSTNSAQRYVIGLNGTDWLTINNLNMEGTGTYAYVLQLYGGADNNVFANCTFSVPTNATSSNQIPVVVSGSSSSYASSSNSGSNNTWQTCTMYSGYACMTFYGPSSGQRNGNNKIYDCNFMDFYNYGIYSFYHWGQHIRGNLIERPNRTSVSTTYGIYCYYTQGTIVEENKIQRLFNSAVNTSATTYCMYFYNYFYPSPTPGGSRNICRNNNVNDIKNNSTLYGMYAYYFDGDIYNNTLSLDYTGTTSGTTYGIYAYTQTGQEVSIKNNLVTIGRGGSGTKYGLYISSPGLVTVDYNNIFISSTAGTNYIGYYNGFQSTFASWQTAGADPNGYNLDPMYVSIPGNDVHPTNPALNNLADPMGLIFDNEGAVRNQNTPDIGALEFLTPNCSGTPSANTVTTPTFAICPGENVSMGLGTLNADAGFTYQWQTSTISNVGPFSSIPGANSLLYTAPNVTANTWFSIVMTCTNPGGGSVTVTGQVMVAGATSSTVPYYEDFEGIGMPNRLPNCSWSASDLGSSNLTYTTASSNNRVPRSGSSFASFSNNNPGTSYFYTNPILLNTGITYSAALYYATEYFGYSNWSELSILVGPNQSTTGLVQVATVSPALSGPYKLLSNTFVVPSAGQYYVAIKAVSTTGNALYLSWDDLSITIPCEPGSPNSPTVQLNASSTTVCAGQPVNLSANGADTYSWSTGASGATIVDSPLQTTNYIVYGNNLITGCTATLNQLVYVNPSPVVFVIADNPVVCSGKPVILSAYGADSYAWSNGNTGQVITVNPTSNTNYTVIGVNAFGCSTSFVQQIVVKSSPNINVISSIPADACKNDVITFNANGAQSYMWVTSVDPQVYQGQSINITLSASAVLTVTGTDANGCAGKATITQNISECTSIAQNGQLNFEAYPNPTSSKIYFKFNNEQETGIELFDVSGRLILSQTGSSQQTELNLTEVPAGLYYAKLTRANQHDVIKIVKQ
jgi:hypothetical protein